LLPKAVGDPGAAACIPKTRATAGFSPPKYSDKPFAFRPTRHLLPVFKPMYVRERARLVATSTELRHSAFQYGRAKKRKNAIAAVLSGALPGVILSHYFPSDWRRWLLGLAIGLVWGNAFEYFYHRWILHRSRSRLARGHLEHHTNVGTPVEAEHVPLGKSPLHIAILFAANGMVVLAADLLFSIRISPGIFLGWTVYLITAEEIHWRIHLEGWLPPGLGFARAYHMAHHDTPDTRYNVFLPLFDLLLGSNHLRANYHLSRRHSASPLRNK
jgi:hypothetical protein